jgi:hypothetical protein
LLSHATDAILELSPEEVATTVSEVGKQILSQI